MIKRQLKQKIQIALKPNHVICLFGARRTGKTILMQSIVDEIKNKNAILSIQGENLDVAEIISSRKLSVIKPFLAQKKYLFIDEAQKIPHIGEALKLIVDTFKDLHIMVTGSSAFDLQQQIGEPLTGRSTFFYMYPFSQAELNEDAVNAKELIESKLLYGMYPQVILAKTNEERMNVLESIRNGYLLKDILELDRLKDSVFIFNLLRLIAFQIGKDISFSELASSLHANTRTIQRYLDILENSFIIFSLNGYSKNLRKEYTKSPRYYFWDNGIRNALLSNFNALRLRDDTGLLWENFCMSERMKRNHNTFYKCNSYFWRTYDQQEVDLIEEKNGKLKGFEFKWGTKSVKAPGGFINTYTTASFNVINPSNYLDFICK